MKSLSKSSEWLLALSLLGAPAAAQGQSEPVPAHRCGPKYQALQVRCGAPEGSGEASADRDGDGLPDAVEDCLLIASAPVLRFDEGEECPAHSGVAARVSYGSTNRMATVRGVFLFHEDCGDLLGYTAHDGDSENYSFRWQYCGEGRWAAETVWMAAHAGEPTDSSSSGPVRALPLTLYVAENKHGLYPDPRRCDLGGLCLAGIKADWACSDHCGSVLSRRWSHPRMYNVGERQRRLVDDLSRPPWSLSYERVFTAMDFCGGRRPGSGRAKHVTEARCRAECADSIYSKLDFGEPADPCRDAKRSKRVRGPLASFRAQKARSQDRRPSRQAPARQEVARETSRRTSASPTPSKTHARPRHP